MGTASTALALVAILSLLLMLFAASPRPVLADGNGSPDECLDTTEGTSGSIAGTDDEVSFTAAEDEVVSGVCIKTGVDGGHTGVITTDGVVDDCYTVEGIGTRTVTVTRTGTESPDCQGISHIDVLTEPDSASLTVTKIVINDDGGTAVVADFDLFIDGSPVVSGTVNDVSAGDHVVSETPVAGYTGTIGGDCDADGNVTVAAGDDLTCTITNDDDAILDESGNVAIFKTMCESIGQQDTCNGRDTSLDGYMVDFEIRAGAGVDGELIETATVTLSENAEGEGNTGNGSQGRILSADLEPGTYTVCEIPVAYLLDEGGNVIDEVDLEAVPRPEAGNGGSTGGNQEQIAGTDCVVVEVTAGTAEVKFLDTIADQGQQLGSLLIAKVDADGNLLPGATFTVDGVAHADTDEDGLVCVDGLTLGDMVSIEETVAPEGFVGDDDIEDVEVTSTEDCATRLAAEDPATDADIAVVNAESGVGPEETVEVSIMKHLCTDVASVSEFEAIEAAAAEENPDNAFAPLVATVLACPTIVLTGDIPTEGAVSGGAVDFEFSVVDASGTQLLSEDGTFMQGALCESDVNLDADGDGTIEEDVCLDVSHYSFEVIDGVVVITETDAPDGHRFGTIRFTPGSDDADTLVGSIASVEATGVITLDTTRDEDDTVMVHAYNFVTEGTQGGNPVPNERPREGTLGGNPVPDTAMEAPPVGTIPGSLLALVLLGALGIAGHHALAEARKRS